jgi:hypothetical protein
MVLSGFSCLPTTLLTYSVQVSICEMSRSSAFSNLNRIDHIRENVNPGDRHAQRQ